MQVEDLVGFMVQGLGSRVLHHKAEWIRASRPELYLDCSHPHRVHRSQQRILLHFEAQGR